MAVVILVAEGVGAGLDPGGVAVRAGVGVVAVRRAGGRRQDVGGVAVVAGHRAGGVEELVARAVLVVQGDGLRRAVGGLVVVELALITQGVFGLVGDVRASAVAALVDGDAVLIIGVRVEVETGGRTGVAHISAVGDEDVVRAGAEGVVDRHSAVVKRLRGGDDVAGAGGVNGNSSRVALVDTVAAGVERLGGDVFGALVDEEVLAAVIDLIAVRDLDVVAGSLCRGGTRVDRVEVRVVARRDVVAGQNGRGRDFVGILDFGPAAEGVADRFGRGSRQAGAVQAVVAAGADEVVHRVEVDGPLVAERLGVVAVIGVAADGAGVGGVALIVLGRLDDLEAVEVADRVGRVGLPAVAADGAGVGGVAANETARRGDRGGVARMQAAQLRGVVVRAHTVQGGQVVSRGARLEEAESLRGGSRVIF